MIKPFKYIPLRKLPFRYLPPNFATATNMILGLLSIFFSVKGEFDTAAWLIIWAVFLDGLDGLLARVLKARSHFGIEFDSFSDFVSFGLAPVGIVLSYSIQEKFLSVEANEKLWILIVAGFFYILMAAIRLARFNVQTIELGDIIFYGIPTTACAGLIASGYLTLKKFGDPFYNGLHIIMFSTVVLTVFGIMMISTIPILKFRKRKNPAMNYLEKTMSVVCLVFAITRKMPDLLFLLGTTYTIGSIKYGMKLEKQLKEKKLNEVAQNFNRKEKVVQSINGQKS